MLTAKKSLTTVIFTIDFLMSLLGILLAVAFFTLMERKVMGVSHYRKGPTKVVWLGLSQPIADAVKLLSKESMKISASKVVMFSMGPTMSMMVMFLSWMWFEFSFVVTASNLKMILIFAAMSVGIYSMFFMSWGSNSKYALIGGHRAAAQVMSYEVCMFMVVLSSLYLWKTYSNSMISLSQQGFWLALTFLPLFFLWTMLCMAESNRTPFDLAEGESEIVSGFNIEYGMGMFALIFISEYGMILILSFLTGMFFMGGKMMMMKVMAVSFLFIWVRCSFPRVRYNNLMFMAWKMALPYSISLLVMMLLIYKYLVYQILNPTL